MPDSVTAFAPGRVNLIGEHTDYNEGLALPFAIREGVTVQARPPATTGCRSSRTILTPTTASTARAAAGGRLAGVRAGRRAELRPPGPRSVGARLQIRGTVPSGSGLSSSAALEVALCLALLAVSDAPVPDRLELARICSRVENDWVGARTGLLDQIASLCGEPDRALEIDFRSLEVTPVTLELAGYSLVTLDSGERHANAGPAPARRRGEQPGYNQRRDECQRACELLGVPACATRRSEMAERLPQPLRDRARHVITENERVRETVDRAGRRGSAARRGAAQRLPRQPARLLCDLHPGGRGDGGAAARRGRDRRPDRGRGLRRPRAGAVRARGRSLRRTRSRSRRGRARICSEPSGGDRRPGSVGRVSANMPPRARRSSRAVREERSS